MDDKKKNRLRLLRTLVRAKNAIRKGIKADIVAGNPYEQVARDWMVSVAFVYRFAKAEGVRRIADAEQGQVLRNEQTEVGND